MKTKRFRAFVVIDEKPKAGTGEASVCDSTVTFTLKQLARLKREIQSEYAGQTIVIREEDNDMLSTKRGKEIERYVVPGAKKW